jgi:VanZ family protein
VTQLLTTDESTTLRSRAVPKAVALAALAGYWLLLFVSTHVPQPPHADVIDAFDKFLHAGAYAGLTLLVAFNWSLRREFGWRQAIGVLVLLAAFGGFDEVTQLLVSRHCDLLDWCADVVGILAALVLFQSGATFWRRQTAKSHAA